MTHLEELNFLIDKASAIAGSDNKLAILIGTTRMAISDWRNGRRPCPPEQQALIASVAGFDPQQTALRALVQRHKGTPMGDKLMRVLGKPLRATGAAAGFVGAVALAIFSMNPAPSHASPQNLHNVHRGKCRKHNIRYVKRFSLDFL